MAIKKGEQPSPPIELKDKDIEQVASRRKPGGPVSAPQDPEAGGEITRKR